MNIEFKIKNNFLYIIVDNVIQYAIPMESITSNTDVNDKKYSTWINFFNQRWNFDKNHLYQLAKFIDKKVKLEPFDFEEQFFDIEICDYLNKRFNLKYYDILEPYEGKENHINFIRFQFEREENNAVLQGLIKQVVNANLIKHKIIKS